MSSHVIPQSYETVAEGAVPVGRVRTGDVGAELKRIVTRVAALNLGLLAVAIYLSMGPSRIATDTSAPASVAESVEHNASPSLSGADQSRG